MLQRTEADCCSVLTSTAWKTWSHAGHGAMLPLGHASYAKHNCSGRKNCGTAMRTKMISFFDKNSNYIFFFSLFLSSKNSSMGNRKVVDPIKVPQGICDCKLNCFFSFYEIVCVVIWPALWYPAAHIVSPSKTWVLYEGKWSYLRFLKISPLDWKAPPRLRRLSNEKRNVFKSLK